MVRDTSAPIVLLVQPHGDSLDLYTEYLEGQGARCIPVTTAEDALTVAPRADVVVTGILLPGSEDGVALTARLRADERTRHLPIIVLTACVFENERQRAREAGADAFLGKPCLPSELYEEIRRVVTESALRRVRGRPLKSAARQRPGTHEKRHDG
jgi:two-component system, cell cycle response regulator DivK